MEHRTTRPEAHRRARHTLAAFTLIELLLVIAGVGLVATLSAPALWSATSGVRVRLAAAEVAGSLQQARIGSLRRKLNVAVKFRVRDDGVVFTGVYRDGDGDGVRNADIDSGVDPLLRPERPLGHLGKVARFGFPPGARPTEIGNSRPLDRLDDPIRFGSSDLASFSSLGKASPGTVYLTDGAHHLWAVRVSAFSGKVTLFRWDEASRTWD